MRWLWLISVGVTDVQFPVWEQNEYGCWCGPRRFQAKRGGVRDTHEGLLTLLRRNKIHFEAQLPKPVGREVNDRLSFVFEHDPVSDEFLAALDPPEFRLSGQAETIPNEQESTLSLYCPKIAPILPLARQAFGSDSVSVLVLNTRRAEDFGAEARDEPIASGPLVARYLADELGLSWQDSDGKILKPFGSGVATWIDLLVEREAMEDPEAQAQVVARLNEVLRSWYGGAQDGQQQVLVTTSGGMPPLKPLIERVPAIHFGQQRVSLLDQAERGSKTAPATQSPLNFDERVIERESLRFHCVESMRGGDYAGAYGLARRAGEATWVGDVCERLGPLLDLPGRPFRLEGNLADVFILQAAQVETRLCMGDVVGALLRLGSFIESVTWKLISEDARIRDLGLKVDRANESLVGFIPSDHAFFPSSAQYFREKAQGKNQHRIDALTWEWPKWLASSEGGVLDAALALTKVCSSYNGAHPGTAPRHYRNRLAHGAEQASDLREIHKSLKTRGLISGTGHPFGENFLTCEKIAELMEALGQGDLKENMRCYLASIIHRIIED